MERVMEALAGQRIDLPWDFLAVDSGSTDRTLAILEGWRARFPVPLRVRGIHQTEFDHGDTRNLLATLSEGELLVFLTQDAIPAGPDWLERLVRDFDDPRVGAATCRNLPRPDAQLLTKLFSEHDPGYTSGRREVRLPDDYARLDAHARRLLFNFNDVASALRRELWERHPFPRTPFGEDVLMARAFLEAGYTVVYDDEAAVEHSHDYGPAEMRARAEIDGRFNVEWLGRTCVGSRADARELTRRQLERDREALAAEGLAGKGLQGELARAKALRSAAFEGLHAGGRSPRRRPSSRMREGSDLHVLFVVHGFPPDTWAGTEVYTLELARALRARGHRTTVLCREPAAVDGPADFSVRRADFEELEVWRMANRLEHRSLRETWSQPKAEAAFRRLCLELKPDVVHFQHLIHTSAGLVHVARELGLPTVLHLHDYWALCARVQLVRPDGERCHENQGAGCFLCIKERALDEIPRLARIDRLGGPLLGALAGGLRRGARLAGRSARRWEGFGELRERQPFVLGAYAAADLRISPSRFLRTKLLESGAFDPHTTLFSDNGLRTDPVRALRKGAAPDGRLRVGFVGSLVWYKGGEVLLEAMARLADEPVVLHVHGAFEPVRDPHHALLAERAGDNVVFHGRFDNQRLSEVHAGLDVLVVPSTWYENSPITIREAFLTRTPIVASDLGGMAESVRDGVDGMLFRPGDADDLARVLKTLARDRALLGRLAEGTDPGRVKSIADNAAEMEFRYRALVCVVRETGPRLLLDRAGAETSARAEPVQVQGADLLLLRPGGGAAEYDLGSTGAGPRRIEVDVLALGSEPGVRLGGRIVVGDQELGVLEPFAAAGRDETRTFGFDVVLPERAGSLRIEARTASGDLYLRIQRVRVREQAANGSAEARP